MHGGRPSTGVAVLMDGQLIASRGSFSSACTHTLSQTGPPVSLTLEELRTML